jgi:hypothetical protein
MADAKRDGNYVTTLLAVSSVDGVTPVTLYANPTTHRLLVDLAGGGSGTVQTVSVATANGFAGTSDGNASAPTLTLTTTVNGILKGNGTAISAITVGSGLSYDGTTLSATAGGGNVSKVGTPVDNELGVWTGDGTLEGDPFLTWDGDSLYVTSQATAQIIAIKNDSGAVGAAVQLFHDSATPATADVVGEIQFYGKDSASNGQLYSSISSVITDPVSASEDGKLVFGVATAGTLVNEIELTGSAIYPTADDGLALGSTANKFSDLFLASGGVINWDNGNTTLTHSAGLLTLNNTLAVGSGAANGVVQSNGNFDLVIQTGNATTGNITIADGANGDITVAPNGSSGTFHVRNSVSVSGEDFYAYSGNGYAGFGSGNGSAYYVDAIAQTGSTYLRLCDDDPGILGPTIELYHNSASPAANDTVGWLAFSGEDSAGNKQNYAYIKGIIVDPTSTSEDGKLAFRVVTAGSLADELELTGAALYPTTSAGLDLGTTTLGFNDLHLAEGGVINWDNGDATLTQVGNDVTLAGASLTARVKPRTGTTTSSATPTINTDDVDFYSITAQSGNITSFTTNLSGTPTDGQRLWIALTATSGTPSVTWGASFEDSTVTAPTVLSTTRQDVGFVWNVATSKWRCVAKA